VTVAKAAKTQPSICSFRPKPQHAYVDIKGKITKFKYAIKNANIQQYMGMPAQRNTNSISNFNGGNIRQEVKDRYFSLILQRNPANTVDKVHYAKRKSGNHSLQANRFKQKLNDPLYQPLIPPVEISIALCYDLQLWILNYVCLFNWCILCRISRNQVLLIWAAEQGEQ